MSRAAAGKVAAQRKPQRGGFVMGLVAGLLIGLALALGVALYITKAPVPFIDKVPQRTPEQDQAEVERNRSWDPNALLGGKPARVPAAPAPATSAAGAEPLAQAASAAARPPAPAASVAHAPSARNPAAILAGGAVAPAPAAAASAAAFDFFVQAGAYTRTEDAEGQRAALAMLGQQARVTERVQAGRTVYRVRMGPFPSREDADTLQGKLQAQGIEAQIVRVERP